MTETPPHDEMLHPQSIAMLEHIGALLPDEEKGILSEKGRLNEDGRGISEKVYQNYLSKVNGNYKELLTICKETESLLNPEDTDTRDNETLKIDLHNILNVEF